MAQRFYLVPKVGDGLTPFSAFRPKYTDPDDLGAGWNLAGRWQALDYGSEASFLMAADVTGAEHTSLSAQTDVLAVPPALDNNVSAIALATVRSKLEAANLPGSWVTTSHTYRQVLRTVRRAITLVQRYRGLHGLPLFDGVTLATQWNQLTQAQKDRFRAAADDLGLDYSAVTNDMTLRQILKLVADQLPDITLGGETL